MGLHRQLSNQSSPSYPPSELEDPTWLVSIPIRGGPAAPQTARRLVRARLDGEIPAARLLDVSLIVSELVTNSVLHADVGPHQWLTVDLEMFGDRLRITVNDPGSQREPQLLVADEPLAPGGLGLRLVDQLSTAWGVGHDPVDTTQVWCDLLLEERVSS
jgi:anti-sigma regulatory factor (Ser/Thr protein kinase)